MDTQQSGLNEFPVKGRTNTSMFLEGSHAFKESDTYGKVNAIHREAEFFPLQFVSRRFNAVNRFRPPISYDFHSISVGDHNATPSLRISS